MPRKQLKLILTQPSRSHPFTKSPIPFEPQGLGRKGERTVMGRKSKLRGAWEVFGDERRS